MLTLEKLAQLGTFAAAIVSAAALVLTYMHIKSAMAIQREILARQAYHNILKLALEHDVLAAGDLEEIGKRNLFTKYRWYFFDLLLALEDIATECFPDENWERLIFFQLRLHKAYLLSAEFKEEQYPLLYVPMKQLVDKVISDAKGS